MSAVVEWLHTNLPKIVSQKVPGVQADLDNRFILVGHSGGGHTMTRFLAKACDTVKMLILLSPVDGLDPFGKGHKMIIEDGKKLPFAVPTFVLSAGRDNQGAYDEPPCAPNNVSNMHFYNAMSGPKWYMNFVHYGHIDFYNPEYWNWYACSNCDLKNCSYTDYRDGLKLIFIDMVDAVFNKNRTALETFEKGDYHHIQNTHQHDYQGYEPLSGGFCKRLDQT